MGRFLVGVLFALALFWGYETYWREDGAHAEQRSGAADAFRESGEVAPLGTGREPAADPRAAGESASVDDPPAPGAGGAGAAEFARAVAAGDAQARATAFATLIRLDGSARDRLAAAIVTSGRSAETTEQLFALLGNDNSFLHAEEGRQLADRALDAIAADPDRTRQSDELTRLLELCMLGPIERGDQAARATVDRIRERHRIVVRQVAFDPMNVAGAKRYVVQSGDSLDGIAAKMRSQLGVPIESGTIAVFNRISNPNVLRAEQALKIPLEPIRTVVSKRSYLVAVYCGPTIVRTYWCAVGREGHDTPEATFRIGAKIEHPDWHFEGRVIPFGHPDNALGTHFVKFEHPAYTGFGVHGTTEPGSIGTRASLGCIRLGGEDIADYFLLVPRGTEVEVRP